MTERPEDEPDHRSEDGLPDAELSGDNLERRFSELVAGLDTPTWPDEEPEPAEPPPALKPKEEPTLLELWDAELPEDAEEAAAKYTPPPPPPVPRPSGPAVGGLLLIILGIVLLVQPGLLQILSFGRDFSVLVGAAIVLSGVAILIWRLRPGDEDDPYDPEDGAVV